MKKRLLTIFAWCAWLPGQHCHAEIRVVPVFAHQPVEMAESAAARGVRTIRLGSYQPGDAVFARVSPAPDPAGAPPPTAALNAFIVDAAGLQAFMRRPGKDKGAESQRKNGSIFLVHRPQIRSNYFLVLDNRRSQGRKIRVGVTVQAVVTMGAGQVERIRADIDQYVRRLQERFSFAGFDITVRPCGVVNAFSAKDNGHITLCSEAVSAAAGMPGALAGIVYHEAAHSLLRQWQSPHADNEDVADEFAAQMLLRGPNGVRDLKQFAAFFSGRWPWLEAVRNDRHEGGHSRAGQRSANLLAFVAQAPELTRRWNRLLYPHATAALLNIARFAPGSHDDADLAASEMDRRSLLAQLSLTPAQPPPDTGAD